MGLLILGALLARNDIDWSQFEILINESIPATKDMKAFRKNLDGKIREFKKDHKVEDGDLAYDVFKIQNSKLWFLRMGWFAASGCNYVVRPQDATFQVEAVAEFSDFKPYFAVLDHGYLVLAGSEYSISNAKHPAVVSYRHRAQWDVKSVQVAEFEGGAYSFVKKGNTWTCFAQGRTYPKHMAVPHSAANVGMQRTFVERDGELLSSHDQTYPSLMGTFDDLVASTLNKNWSRVRMFCASDAIASKLQKLTSASKANEWRIMSEDFDTHLRCRVADTEWVAVMEKIGKTWKVTKFERFKDPE